MGEIIVAARNSAPRTLARMAAGWRPKAHSEAEEPALALIQRLGADSEELGACVQYFVDLAFFTLLASLELGEGEVEFELTARDEVSGESLVLIDSNEDRDLRGRWFQWLERFGQQAGASEQVRGWRHSGRVSPSFGAAFT